MDDQRADALNRLLIAHEQARAVGAESAPTPESVPAGATLSDPIAVLHRTDRSIAQNGTEDRSDPAEFKAARDLVSHHAEAALDKLSSGNLSLSGDQLAALEAVVIADGTRPSFLLTDGRVDPADPFIGTWANEVAANGDGMRRIARATGRIQPANGHASRYIGTGVLLDAGKMQVLTNYHVIDDARTKFGVAMTQTGNALKVDGTLEIDFLGEATSLERNRFRIVGVDLPTGYGRGFGVVDAAVATIEPIDDRSVLPEAAPRPSRDTSYADGGMLSLATIGFPGPPVMDGDGTIDWTFVTRTLFANKFGFKRLAPGTYTSGRGSNPLDKTTESAFGHNATTFGGASGSLVVAWADTGPPSFGLHFVGSTGRENNALAFAVVADALGAVGVDFG